jgi:hypothetical protein
MGGARAVPSPLAKSGLADYKSGMRSAKSLEDKLITLPESVWPVSGSAGDRSVHWCLH